ncbi:MAG: carbohydrate-binding domain-containing protein [Oscillospiraceae bacterium]|nr:carbohydrate-binding domain-containing protein [Oscillospiraceae bacterium]
MKKWIALLLCFCLLLSGCAETENGTSEAPAENPAVGEETGKDAFEAPAMAAPDVSGASVLTLADDGITLDGEAVTDDSSAAVYTANDIVFYPEGKDFTFGEGTEADEHSQEEADAHTVVHITQPGAYVLTGSLSAGQIAVDLGEEAEEDPNAVVTLVLDNVDITCTVAPAVIFYNVYECGSKDVETATHEVDTSAAGANVIIADDSKNNIAGSYVARIYKSIELSEDGTEVVDSKKLHKYDAAFYSKMSMNLFGGEKGTGTLNISAENEGLDTELHLTINGGNINITSGNDGINTNEDGVSVTTINGGSLLINVSGTTGEGDGIDSNGWLVINGGQVIASACADSADAGIDSELGIFVNGGQVIAGGNMLDRLEDGGQNYAVFTFSQKQTGNELYSLQDENGTVVGQWSLANDFTMLVFSYPGLVPGTYTLWQGDTQLSASSGGKMGSFGGGMMAQGGFEDGEGMTLPDGERPEGGLRREEIPEGEMPEKGERPEMPEGEIPEGELPEGMELPEDGEMRERPQGGGRGDMELSGGEVSTDLTIVDGANYFQIA